MEGLYNKAIEEHPVSEKTMDAISKLKHLHYLELFVNSRNLTDLSPLAQCREPGMKVTQDGVETAEQMALLKKLGCHVIQGYHYARPLRLFDYIEFITRKSHSELFTKRL